METFIWQEQIHGDSDVPRNSKNVDVTAQSSLLPATATSSPVILSHPPFIGLCASCHAVLSPGKDAQSEGSWSSSSSSRSSSSSSDSPSPASPVMSTSRSNECEPEWWSTSVYKEHFEQSRVRKPSTTNLLSNEVANRNSGLNRLGGRYQTGKPLPVETRQQIVALSIAGVRPTEISRRLKVSHGGVSKILQKYRENGTIFPEKIGGSKPKKSVPHVLNALSRYLQHQPQMSAWELQTQLLEDNVVPEKQLPSVSLINRMIRLHFGRRPRVRMASDSSCSGSSNVANPMIAANADSLDSSEQHFSDHNLLTPAPSADSSVPPVDFDPPPMHFATLEDSYAFLLAP